MKVQYNEKEYSKAYNAIKKRIINSKKQETYPLAVLIGGQPGSGKSALSKFILSQNQNTIIIDGDYIREFYPHLEEIIDKHKDDYPKLTQPFVNRVVEQLIDELSKEHYNLIIEGTLRDINVPLKTAQTLDERGYIVELYVMATDKDISWKSTIERGKEMEMFGRFPRYVEKEHHDKVAKSLPETVEKLSKNDIFYNIVIMRRDQTIIYDKQETPELNPREILEHELNGIKEKNIEEIISERKSQKHTTTIEKEIKQATNEIENDNFSKTNIYIDNDLDR